MWSQALVRLLYRKETCYALSTVAVSAVALTLDPVSDDNRDSIRTTTTNTSLCEAAVSSVEEQLNNHQQQQQQAQQQQRQLLRTRQTVRLLEQDATKGTSLESQFDVNWQEPLGRGSFGVVYLGTHKRTKEQVAVKKISKRDMAHQEIQLELQALLRIHESGSHPNICSLRQSFSEDDCYYLILDLVAGGEMFDHLVQLGAYSEEDAARLVREAASAVAFLHSLGMAHCDLKPENLMLSSTNPSDAVIKLIDFGCARIINEKDESEGDNVSMAGRTLAYCPPEVLQQQGGGKLDLSIDCWALGVILYIMLVGIHPYDLSGQATDDEVAQAVMSGKRPPLHNSPLTAHLSESAIDLIDQLMQWDPKKRLTADQMLEHPWTKGETAKRAKMVDSDKKLKLFRKYKSGIAKTAIDNMLRWSDDSDNDDVARRVSLIERNFRSLDKEKRGYLVENDLVDARSPKPTGSEPEDRDPGRLSLSDFSDLLSENLQNRYFPKGSIIYHEGEIGNAMYFINSGTVSVETTGSVAKRGPGDFFGEGALLSPTKRRSATLRCDTPVHAMQVSREYFEKYMAKSDSDLMLTLREKDKIRKRNRAKMVLRSLPDLKLLELKQDEYLFKKGDDGHSMYLCESGRIQIFENENHVFTANPGNAFGEYSLLMGKRRNCTAICGSPQGCVVKVVPRDKFEALVKQSPDIEHTLRDLCLRRDFKKAVVMRLKKEFPYDNPREAFDSVKTSQCPDNGLNMEAVGMLMRELNPEYTEEEIREIVETLDLTHSGEITFDEFKKVFVADIRKSASV